MPLLQRPASTSEELEASKPVALEPEEVDRLDESAWYARAYRGDVPQLTARALLLGSGLGFLLALTNVYVGLKTGWFLGVNLTATILSYAVWRALSSLGIVGSPMTILEQSCAVSTASSAGYATGNMVVSAIPAMLLLSVTRERPGGDQLSWEVVALWVFFLAALGVVLAIPMKREMINRERLRFPSGMAAAVALRGFYMRGDEALAKARALLASAGVAALFPLLRDLAIRRVGRDPTSGASLRAPLLRAQSNAFDGLAAVLPDSWTRRMLGAGPPELHPGGAPLHFSDYQLRVDHGLVLSCAGVLVGLRLTAWMAIAGLVLAVGVTPLALDATWTDPAGITSRAVSTPDVAWKELGLWAGAPLLVASAVVQLVGRWRTILAALSGLVRSGWGKAPPETPAVDPEAIEIPRSWFVAGLVFAGGGVTVVARLAFGIPIHYGLFAVAMTIVLAAVACRATGESDLTPSSALGKITQLTYGVLMPQNTTANLQTGAITAGAATASADLLTDLKCGYLLGGSPRRQFLAQAAGILSGTIATVLCYFVLVPDATALVGTAAKTAAFPAPNAQLWKAVAEVLGRGMDHLHPWSRSAMAWGAGLGVLLGCAESLSPAAYKRWIPSAVGIGLGLLLPFPSSLAMLIGALAGEIAKKVNKTRAESFLVVIAAGGIAGESVVGVAVQAVNNFFLDHR